LGGEAVLYCPLSSHESGLREFADNSIVLADDKEALIAKLNPERKKVYSGFAPVRKKQVD